MLTTNLLSLRQARAAFPSRGNDGMVSVSTLWRWMTEGKRGIKLRYSTSAGRRMISTEAIQDFIKATNEAAGATEVPTVLCMAARARIARQQLAERYGLPTWKLSKKRQPAAGVNPTPNIHGASFARDAMPSMTGQ